MMQDIKFDLMYKGDQGYHHKKYHISEIAKGLNKICDIHNQMVFVAWRQYTGMKDKNDVDIYEGDIVKNCYGFNVAIKWFNDLFYDGNGGGHSGFYFDGEFELNWNLSIDDSVIVGNIYENPELLKD